MKRDLQLITDILIAAVPDEQREPLADAILDGIIRAVEALGLHCGGTVQLVEAHDEEKRDGS